MSNGISGSTATWLCAEARSLGTHPGPLIRHGLPVRRLCSFLCSGNMDWRWRKYTAMPSSCTALTGLDTGQSCHCLSVIGRQRAHCVTHRRRQNGTLGEAEGLSLLGKLSYKAVHSNLCVCPRKLKEHSQHSDPRRLPGNRQKGIAVVKPSLPLGSTCMFGAQHSLLPPELNEPFMRHMVTKAHHRNTRRQFSAKIHENNHWFLFRREITKSFVSHY